MKIDKTASVKMRWDTFSFPIKVGTPVSAFGVMSNNGNAYGLVIRTVPAKPDADEFLQVMTDGVADMEEVVAGFGAELTTDAMTALSGIHVFKGGVRVNPSDESADIAALNTALTKVSALIAPPYSKKNWAEGDLVTYNGKLYKAKADITSENWTAAHWDVTTVAAELVALAAAFADAGE